MMYLGRHSRTRGRCIAGICAIMALGGAANSAADDSGNTLESVDYAVEPGNRIELQFKLSSPAREPRAFTIQDPARIALDFQDTSNATGKRSIPIEVGIAKSLNLVEAQGRTRAVLNLSGKPQYSTSVDGNIVRVALASASTTASSGTQATQASDVGGDQTGAAQARGASDRSADGASHFDGIDFRRGEDDQGRVIVDLASASTPVNVERQGNNVVVELPGTTIPSDQRRRLDVLDFATPVKFVDIKQRGSTGRIEIVAQTQEYEQLTFQSGGQVTVELRPLSDREVAEQEEDEDEYTGEKLSLNFQDIGVRSVLQLLADFTGLNVVVSDSVDGNVTLRLKEVPWDQALDIILRSEGLAKRRNGNVIVVAPQQEIAAREQAELEAKKKEEELAPLRTEYIQVNYAKASDLAGVIQSESSSLITERASVTVDQRTNTLLVNATATNLTKVRQLVERLDVPVRQVMIESRIVIANNDFNKELGVRFGVNRDTTNDGEGVIFGGSSDAVTNLGNNSDLAEERYNVNLPANNPSGTAGLALAKLPFGTLLELELSAMQAEGRGEVISTPRVITANQNEASIQQGVEIPYQEAASSGATSVSFKEAVLELAVTPQITPDERIIMDLDVKKDQVGQVFNGVPSVDTQEVQTQVLVDNGETVVLGGIYEEEEREQTERVPFFGDLPLVGRLFRTDLKTNNKSELLIFVTPRIVEGGTGVEY